MRPRLLIAVVFVGAVVLAVGGWIVEGVRWLFTAPVRRLRAGTQSAGRLAG